MSELSVALIVRIVAKPGKETQVGRFLAGALPLAQAERFTPVWFALQTGPNVFYIVDAFGSDADRAQHLQGTIAKALMAQAEELLSEAPTIENAAVLGAKVVV